MPQCEVLKLVMQASAWHKNLHRCPLGLWTYFPKITKGVHTCKTLGDTGKCKTGVLAAKPHSFYILRIKTPIILEIFERLDKIIN